MKVLTPDEVSELVGVSTASLERYRNDGIGPNFLRIGPGGLIKYLASDVEEWLMSCRQLPPIDGSKAATPAQLTAAITAGSAERRAAMKARNAELDALSAADRESLNGVTPLVVGGVGETPGSNFQKFNSVPAQQFNAPAPPHILAGR